MKQLILSVLAGLTFLCPVNAQDIEHVLSGLTTDKQKADTLYYFSLHKFYRNTFDSAIILLNRGMSYAERTGDFELIGKYIILHSNVLYLKEENARGLSMLKKAWPYIQQSGSYVQQDKYYFLSGLLFERLYKNDSAIYYYHLDEALNNRENPYRNWLVYDQMTRLFQYVDAFEEAERYVQKAHTLTASKGIRIDYGIVLNTMAELYYLWGKADKFAAVLEEQRRFIEAGKKDYSRDPVHSMLYIDWNNKNFGEKITFMENVKQKFLQQGSNMNVTMANTYMAGFYEEAKKPIEALKYIRENQQIFRNEKNIIDLYLDTKTAYRLLKQAGKTDEAIAAADELFSLKDSIISIQQRQILLDLNAKYETAKKEKDIALLNSENRLNEIRLARETDKKKALERENLLKDSVMQRQKDYNLLLSNENTLKQSQLTGEKALKEAIYRESVLKGNELTREKRLRLQLIAGASLLLLCGLVIFIMYRRQRAKSRLIQKQADELQILMREIHHRVKNNLQVISSLLDLQSLTIGDQQASEAIKESRNRVYSMALIHQNLYKEDNIMSIEMADYINKLSQSLFESYNAGENKIHLETDIDTLMLDVDMVIPIGLVLNELISNALKYAFCNRETGILQIAFKKSDSELVLKVKDNGRGFPKGLNIFQTQSFGYKLIKAFAQKLKARLEVYNDNGACVLLHIRKMKPV